MNETFINYHLGLYEKQKDGVKIPQNFGNRNYILDTIKKLIQNNNNFLFVASDEYEYDITDAYVNIEF